MCNRRITTARESLAEPYEVQVDSLMDSPTLTRPSLPSSNEDNPRVKFLCSFNGSILPRPQDGKLRYVGGETRIVSVPRDISYEELMSRMKELFESATVLRYQQPDEDLDALVSVVNNDDVTNMMEEYDKLGSGDGFTRLRIFLFSSPDQDDSLQFVEGDELDNERRYVDALNNSPSDSPDFGKQHSGEFQVIAPVDDIQLAEPFYGPMNLEGSVHNQRIYEMSMPQISLRQLTIPRLGSVQHQRYSEMETPWSPVYYTPGHAAHVDPRPMAEFPFSPSSARYHTPYGDFSERTFDRTPEEYSRQQQVNHQSVYDQQPQLPENVVWLPPEKTGFPGNMLNNNSGITEGNNICEHCRSPFPRNQPYPDPLLNHREQPNPDLLNMGNAFPHVGNNPCADCPSVRGPHTSIAEAKFHHPFFSREQNDLHRPFYNESHIPRPHSSRVGWFNDRYIIDGGNVINSVGPVRYTEAHLPGPTGSYLIHPPLEERGIRYVNVPHSYGVENQSQASHGHLSAHPYRKNVQSPMYEASGTTTVENSIVSQGFVRCTEASPGFQVGVENQIPWVESLPKMIGFDGTVSPDPIQSPPGLLISSMPVLISDAVPSSVENKPVSPLLPAVRDIAIESTRTEANYVHEGGHKTNDVAKLEYHVESLMATKSGCLHDGREDSNLAAVETKMPQVGDLSHVPELTVIVEKASLDGIEVLKGVTQNNTDPLAAQDGNLEEDKKNESEAVDGTQDFELDPDKYIQRNSKIEPTKAEEEAIARGLQTIKNDDLEEVRELGSGTYGAVYHGKWKGSDVAIKRIKASCFAGRPSERERLIADFWKEALILSSLHHPNVVSFYGIVRDGPDGSLATVTEFMVNGSLKQFLLKKDRTIDRRKRLIIAMDAAFGMEYLHGKNIVHFDLKCENLLVNMRDPHRPVCKIGDLGLSKVKQHTLVSGGVRGTLPWMAPELLSGKSHMVTEKIDVYSFGIVMWELLTGDEPYSDMHCASMIGGIVNNTLRPKIPTWCDPEWKLLMESCWSSEPAQRPSFSEISQRLRSMGAAMNLK